MCFSAEADFGGGALVALAGVQTLRHVHVRRELIIGSLPLLLGLHQIVEGFVWLGLRGQVATGLSNAAKLAYIVFAHVALPVIVPLGLVLLEPDRRRVRWVWPLACLGMLLGTYMLWQVTAFPVGAHVQARCIDYTTHTPNDPLIAGLYVLVTCGPALLSSFRHLRWFGLLALLGVIAAAIVRVDELTSVWCLYAALVSGLILVHFRGQPRPAAMGRHLRCSD